MCVCVCVCICREMMDERIVSGRDFQRVVMDFKYMSNDEAEFPKRGSLPPDRRASLTYSLIQKGLSEKTLTSSGFCLFRETSDNVDIRELKFGMRSPLRFQSLSVCI